MEFPAVLLSELTETYLSLTGAVFSFINSDHHDADRVRKRSLEMLINTEIVA